jgi:predicted nucleotidyltransferase
LLDLSNHRDFAPLANLVAELRAVAGQRDIGFLLIGATARDVMFKAFGVTSERATADVDFAFVVASWENFIDLRAALLASARFVPHEKQSIHKLRHAATQHQLDIVPFGVIEDARRKVLIPPENDFEFDCFGIQEAYAGRVDVALPGPVIAQVASIPALAILKIMAFNDRKHTLPGRDASDLMALIRNYLVCGNMDRFFAGHADLCGDDFDYDFGCAQLLARDIATMLTVAGLDRLLDILAPEIDPDGGMQLAGQAGMPDDERARRIIEALVKELKTKRDEVN